MSPLLELTQQTAASLATLAFLLRRAHAHTGQSTTFPSVLHLCSLPDEYL